MFTTKEERLGKDELLKVIATFTKKEKAFLNDFICLLYAEYGFSDVTVDDFTCTSKFNPHWKSEVVRGLIGSLSTKDVLWTWEEGGFIFIILSEEFYGLHEEWAAATDMEFIPVEGINI